MFLACRSPVKVEYESDKAEYESDTATGTMPSPELGVPPPVPSKAVKGKNRARSISPVNLVSDDEIPADTVVEK
jgi:hypothetical protein